MTDQPHSLEELNKKYNETYPWFQVVTGSPAGLRVPVKIGQLVKHIEPELIDGGGNHREAYCSFFQYDNQWANSLMKTKTTAGIKGKVWSQVLPLDIDSSDITKAHDQLGKFISWWTGPAEGDPRDLRYYFSGNKGFHVMIPAACFGGFHPNDNLPDFMKSTVEHIVRDAGLDEAVIDRKIYERNRIFRWPNSVNEKAGYKKSPIHYDKIPTWTIKDAVKAGSQDVFTVEFRSYTDVSVCPGAEHLFQTAQRERIRPDRKGEDSFRSLEWDFSKPIREGERNDAMFKLSCVLRDKGVDEAMTGNLVSLVNMSQCGDAPLNEYEVQRTVASCFQHSKEDEDVDMSDIHTLETVWDDYLRKAEESESNKVSCGLPEIDNDLRYMRRGEVVTILARSGVGKSALIVNILLAAAKQGLHSYFQSLEMVRTDLFERASAVVTGIPCRELEHWAKTAPEQLRRRLKKALFDSGLLQFIKPSDKAGLSLQQIERRIVRIKEDNPELALCAIDYSGLIRGRDDSNPYNNLKGIYEEIKVIAKRHNVVMLILHQVSREKGGDGDRPLSMHSGIDSSAVEHNSDSVIGLYRPHKIAPHVMDNAMTVQVLKARKGTDGTEYSYRWLGALTTIAPTAVPLQDLARESPPTLVPKEEGELSGDKKVNDMLTFFDGEEVKDAT